MAEDDEIIDARVLIGLELLLKQLAVGVGAEFEEKFACDTDELLVGIVGGAFVLLFPHIDSVYLFI